MNNVDHQQIAANYMGALAHLLGGRPGRHQEFIDKVELILSGNEPRAMQLLQLAPQVRITGRPIIWVHHAADVPGVPQIGLVAHLDGRAHIMENCMLWMAPDDGRAQLVPDSFKLGSYQFDDNLRLQHTDETPSKSFKAAEPAMEHAYARLLEIEMEQRENGDVFALPTLAKAA